MTTTVNPETTTAHDEMVALIESLPQESLDWQPGGDDWSIRQIISHIAGAGDFFTLIVRAAREANFGQVTLDRETVGRQLAGHQQAFAACTTVAEMRDYFERAYQRSLEAIATIAPEELDRPFTMNAMRPGAAPAETTLRQRVVHRTGEHLNEHAAQIRATLDRWRQAQSA